MSWWLLLSPAWAGPETLTLLVPALTQLGISGSLEEELPRSTLSVWKETSTLWVTTSQLEETQLDQLLSIVRKGGTAVMVVDSPPAKLTQTLNLEFTPTHSSRAIPVAWTGEAVEVLDSTFGMTLGGQPWLPDQVLAVTQTVNEAHQTTQATVAARINLGAGTLVVVGIPDLLDDASVLHPTNLHFIASLIQQTVQEQGLSKVGVLDERGPPADTPFSAMLRAGLGPALLQSLVVFLLAAWWKGWPFARPVDPPAILRRDFTEHLYAAARLYRAAGAGQKMLLSYATLVMGQLRTRTRAPDGDLVKALAVRTQIPEERIRRILDHVRFPPPAIIGQDSASQDSTNLYLQEELWEITQASLKDTPTPPPSNSLPSPTGFGGWKLK